MIRLVILFLIGFNMYSQPLFRFTKETPNDSWRVIDDVVMGGRSQGHFKITTEGYGEFSGNVSLENNGGFSSLRHPMQPVAVKEASQIRIHLKGDGKTYQFRLRHRSGSYYSYTCNFKTTGEWEEVALPLKDFKPVFRGRELDLPAFDQEEIAELGFLIANKKPQAFRLLIETITLE